MNAVVTSEAVVPFSDFEIPDQGKFNDLGLLPQGSIDNLARIFLSGGLVYEGLAVSAASTAAGETKVEIGTGHLFRGGLGHMLREPGELDLASYIRTVPDSAKTLSVLIVVDGAEVATTGDVTFLDQTRKPADPNAYWPTVDLSAPLRTIRTVVPSPVEGTADVQPKDGNYDTTRLLPIARVIVGNTGILSVTQLTGRQAVTLDQLWLTVAALSARADTDELTIAGLQSTVSGLALTFAARLAADEANLTALANRLSALESRTVTTATGSILTIVDTYTDTSGLTLGDGTGYGVGTGLTFPQSTKNPTTYFPINAYGSNLKLLGGRYLTAPYIEKFVLGQLANTDPSRVNMGAEAPWNAALKLEGFGVARTRYGASYPAQAATQLFASGDPARLFAINPGDIVYDPSWQDWRVRNPEFNHGNGYWHDLTSREPWTPRTADGTARNVQAISHPINKPYPEMLTSFIVANGNMDPGPCRLLVCEDLNGAPDPSAVLMDVAGYYAQGYGAGFDFPYPFLRKANKLYHFVLLAPSGFFDTNKAGGTPLLHLSPNGSWSPDPNGYGLSCGYKVAQFTQGAPIELNLLFLGGGIDNIDLIAPAIVPDGCDVLYGTIPQGSASYTRFGPIDPANPASNLLAGRPSQLRPFVELIVTAATAPVIDLQASVTGSVGAVSARRGTTLTAESAVRAPKDANGNPLAVSKVTRTVTLVGFNPALHTYSESLETGANYATLTPPTTAGTPTAQADGTTLMTFSWTIAAPGVTTFKNKYLGNTSDSAQQFRLSQSITTAAP